MLVLTSSASARACESVAVWEVKVSLGLESQKHSMSSERVISEPAGHSHMLLKASDPNKGEQTDVLIANRTGFTDSSRRNICQYRRPWQRSGLRNSLYSPDSMSRRLRRPPALSNTQ